MKNAILTVAITALAATSAPSCGGGSSSLDSSARVADLNSDQQKKLCDEIASAQGGYGRSATCPDGSLQTTDANQAACLGAFSTLKQFCPNLTVGDSLNCADGTGRDLCTFTTAPACKAVRDCIASATGH